MGGEGIRRRAIIYDGRILSPPPRTSMVMVCAYPAPPIQWRMVRSPIPGPPILLEDGPFIRDSPICRSNGVSKMLLEADRLAKTRAAVSTSI